MLLWRGRQSDSYWAGANYWTPRPATAVRSCHRICLDFFRKSFGFPPDSWKSNSSKLKRSNSFFTQSPSIHQKRKKVGKTWFSAIGKFVEKSKKYNGYVLQVWLIKVRIEHNEEKNGSVSSTHSGNFMINVFLWLLGEIQTYLRRLDSRGSRFSDVCPDQVFFILWQNLPFKHVAVCSSNNIAEIFSKKKTAIHLNIWMSCLNISVNSLFFE